jgi:hypothetical protein
MSGTDEPKIVPAAAVQDEQIESKEKNDLERTQSADFDKSNVQNYDKVDKEVAKYASDSRIEISEEENTRLRRLIDKRVLLVMISTYFLQAIDKGTMSFAAIMGVREDTNLVGQEVGSNALRRSGISI